MASTELIRTLGDLVEIAIMILIAYIAYKIATLIDTINNKIKGEKIPTQKAEG